MTTNTIERDILIEAPIDVVWRTVTEPDQMTQWYCDAAELDLRPGGRGVLTWNARATGTPTTVGVRVVALERPRIFSFRWLHPEDAEPLDGNSLLVEFTLTPEGERTRLRVVETGLAAMDWSDEQKAAYAEQHNSGWETHLGSLRVHVAGQRRVSPPR